MEWRYSVSQNTIEKESKEAIKKIKNKFRKKANKLNINIMKLNSLTYGSETIYSPFIYNHSKKWVKISEN